MKAIVARIELWIAAFRSKPVAEQACLAVVAVATLFYVGASAWEAFGPLECGHFCALDYVGISAENMLKWRVFGVVLNYTAGQPTPDIYYAHHPYGPILTGVVAQALFGHGSFAIHAPAIFYAAFVPPLLYGLARAAWGYFAAAVATVVFVLVPIDLAFAKSGMYELTTIFSGLIFTWGTVRLWQTWKTRYLVAAVLGAILVCHADWIGAALTGFVCAFAFVRAYVLPRRWIGHIQERKHAQWFVYTVAATLGTVLFYAVLFAKFGKIADLFGSYELRSAGASQPVSAVFSPRRWMWIQWTLPVMTLWAMAVAVPLALARTIVVGAAEIFLPVWFASACLYYFLFKQGADVHIFWPQMFGVAVALSCGCLTAQATALGERVCAAVSAARRAKVRLGLSAAGGVALGLYVIVLGRMGLAQMKQSHLTSGQFDEGGNFITSYRNAAVFADWAMRGLPPSDNLVLHSSFAPAPSVEYTAQRVVHLTNEMTATGPNDPDRYELAFVGQLPVGEMRSWAANFTPEIAGPFWKIDRARPHEPLVAYRYVERLPTWWEAFFVTGTDAIRTIGPIDPFATWEWRSSLNVTPNPPPSSAPSSFEEIRVAHNVALEGQDVGGARGLRDRLEDQLTERKETQWSGDVRLLGYRMEKGTAPIVTLLWEAGPHFVPFDGEFRVRSRIIRPPPLWASTTDFYEKEVAPKEALRPALWKPGFLYSQRFVVLHRIGEESYKGFFTGADRKSVPRPPSGDGIELFTFD
jgi:hypothetical protein